MKFNYNLTPKILKFLENSILVEITIGCSNSQVIKIEKEQKIYYLKIANKGLLTNEYEKLKWLDGKLSVPKIVLYEITDQYECIITETLLGKMLCRDEYKQNPIKSLEIIKEAFNNVYLVDITNCPFNTSLKYQLSIIEKNVKNNLIKEENIKPEVLEKYGSTQNILKYLKANVFEEELCFTHGDPSLPNIFADNGKFTGFIDVGDCGVSDKWFDLAICEKSIKRNYGEEHIQKFYEILGVIPNRKKIDYYLLMLELYL